MSKPKHTPLPWKISEFDEYGGYDCMTAGMGAGPADLDGCRYGQQRLKDIWPDAREQMEADASLIVRACNSHYELLEACEAMETAFRMLDADGNQGCVPEIIHRRRDMLLAAITKARGEA